MRIRPKTRRLLSRRGAVIVEFALVVPFISVIVFGVIDFSRAYGRVNALDSALREGGRYGSKWIDYTNTAYVDAVKVKVKEYGNTYGFTALDTSLVSVSINAAMPLTEYITVTVVNHPIPLDILGKFGAPPLTVSRTVSYRWECAGLPAGTCT